MAGACIKKSPAVRRGPLHFHTPVLFVLTALTALLLPGTIALPHRVVLLLLSGFLTAALLLPRLLTWALLAGVLTLLTRILVLLLRHSGNSLVGRQKRGNGRRLLLLPPEPSSLAPGNPSAK